ncbi:MAG: hypothetical protein WCT05_11745 [Lentisphaeria bacterium]
MMNQSDCRILADLARRYAELCADPVQSVRRALWQRHNSLKGDRPLIYVRAFAWQEMPEATCLCADPFARQYEDQLRRLLFWGSFRDDSIFEPWITVPAVPVCTGWGMHEERHFSDELRGSFKIDYPLRELTDMGKLRTPWHQIDEAETAERVARLSEAVGDILTINVDRGPAYRMWTGDISTTLGYLRGMEHFMLDMYDHPEWLHRLVKFMSDGIQKVQAEAETAGDWGLCAHQNQAMPYAEELEDPSANCNGVKRSQLWGYMAAQEFTAVSPTMFDEFLLQYQLPILKKFGLVAYGCCEDLSEKIACLRQIPNLRRIAVSPFANIRRCAEQIGIDYVLSYRPSPADMVSYGFDPNRIKSILRNALQICRNCHVDITLKDVETVEQDPSRVHKWVALTREVIEEVFA